MVYKLKLRVKIRRRWLIRLKCFHGKKIFKKTLQKAIYYSIMIAEYLNVHLMIISLNVLVVVTLTSG
jgi:hypothetical protein